MAWDDGAVESLEPQKKAVPRAAAPESGYRGNQVRLGAADAIGGVFDAAPRAINLAAAAYGVSPIPDLLSGITKYTPGLAERPASAFRPDLPLPSDTVTGLLQRLLANPEMVRPENIGPIEAAALRGAGAGMITPGAGGLAAIGRNVALNTVAGAAAGAGAGVGEKLVPGSPMAALAGGLIGGVAIPSVGGTLGIAKRLMAEARTPDVAAGAGTIAQKLIDRQMQQSVAGTPGAAAGIDEALALKQKFGPDFQPSMAQMTGSEGAAEMQRRYATLSPDILNSEIAKNAQSRAAVRQAFEDLRAGKSISAARSDVNQAVAAEQARATQGAEGVANAMPVENQQALGSRASDIAGAEKAAAQKVVSSNYERAFAADKNGAQVDLAPVIAEVESILGTKLAQIRPESAPNTVRRLQELAKPKSGMSDEEAALRSSLLGGNIAPTQAERTAVSLRDADSIRKAINQDIAASSRSLDPAAASRLNALGRVHRTIDEAVNSSGIAPEAKTLYRSALDQYRADYVPRFKEGANLRQFRDTSLNEPRILPDKLVSEYFKPDSQAGMTRAQQFGALYKDNPEAADLAKRGIADLYRSKVVDPQTGMVDIRASNRFLMEHGRTLDAWKAQGVNVADDLRAIGSKAAAANEQLQQVANTAKFLKYDTPQQLADAAIASPKVMANALQRMSQKGKDALADMIREKAWGDGSAAGMAQFLDKNAGTLRMVMSDKHIADLRDITKGLEITERSPLNVGLQSGGPDVVKNATGVSVATVYSQMRATTGGRQAPVTMAFNLAAPVLTRLSRLKFQDAMHAALYDEKAAIQLRDLLNAKNATQANYAGTALAAATQAWQASRGPVARILGGDNVLPMIGRTAPAIMSTIQEAAKQ